MHIHILGAAAGGGFPQWNCNCRQCDGYRRGTIEAKARTQSSLCISADGVNWVLFNTSPDILSQLAAFPALQPARKVRDTGIAAIIYMDSQIDHTAGLLMLREGCPHNIYCTDRVYDDLTSGFPVFNMLKHWNGGICRHSIPIEKGSSFNIPDISGLKFSAIALSSKAPPYSPHRDDPHPGDNIGIRVEDIRTGKNVFYAPGLGFRDPYVEILMREADCLLVDGTFWREDEMLFSGVSDKKAYEMGHLPQTGSDAMLALLAPMEKPRKILIHINNTNPILDENSVQRKTLHEQGVEVAFDGMDIEL